MNAPLPSPRRCFAAHIMMVMLIGLIGAPGCRAQDSDSVYAQSGPLSISSAVPNAASVPRFGKFELTLSLSATYSNPFDPAQIDVGAEFRSPSGSVFHAVGFLYQDFTRSLVNGNEVLTPSGAPVWKIRFAPNAAGVWSYTVTATDDSGTTRTQRARFTVTSSSNPGFIRVSRLNHAAFSFEGGESPFFAIGENMGWGNESGTYSYDTWLPKLHAAGGNWIRVWMGAYNNRIEWSKANGGNGLGVYDLANAWRDDRILDIAGANDIYVMLCLGTYGEFTEGGTWNEGQWLQNPYNAINGGPCATPGDFWTNPDAIRLYKQRLRYIMARYGYRTDIQAWELWNETNAPAPWVRQIAQYLKGTGPYAGDPADPYRHLLTTTFGNPDVWKIPEVDWTQTHDYGEGDRSDFSQSMVVDARANTVYGKPHLMGEFGIDWRAPDNKYDPLKEGVNLHNGIWAAAVSGDAGTAMIWWWDSYVDPDNLYHVYTPIAKITKGLPWASAPWHPLRTAPITVHPAAIAYEDMILNSDTNWGKAPMSEFTVDPTQVIGTNIYPGFLFTTGRPDWHSPAVFHVRYAVPGRFTVHVATVSQSGVLQFSVDGRVVQTDTLNAVPPKDGSTPQYKSTQYQPQYQTYQALFDQDYGIDVPAGLHTISIEDLAGDWMSVQSYTLTNYRSNTIADAAVTGTASGRTAFIWVQNMQHNWKNVLDNVPMQTIHAGRTVLTGLPAGSYAIDWYDTDTGDLIEQDTAMSTDSGMPIVLPDFSTDIAATIHSAK